MRLSDLQCKGSMFMTINGIRFTHVAFRASDLERSIRWYESAFGARKVFHAKQEGDRPELVFLEFAKGQFIELFTNGKSKVPQTPDAIGYQHFCVLVDDLEQALAHLATMNVHPHRGPFAGRAQYRIAFISDPDGNIIELMQIQPGSPIYRE
jgi:catechol 2,3-dioxygenase-like lactoylglutathione lyase family enzyme